MDPRLDKNWKDFDITEAALAVLVDERGRPPPRATRHGVRAHRRGIPFARVRDLTDGPEDQAATFDATSLGVDTVETVLLYHVEDADLGEVVAAEGTLSDHCPGRQVKVHVHKGKVTLIDARTTATRWCGCWTSTRATSRSRTPSTGSRRVGSIRALRSTPDHTGRGCLEETPPVAVLAGYPRLAMSSTRSRA